MDRPLISCIVPCFNSRAYVCEALDSIFAQTYSPIEVIIADDGSTDGTGDLVRERYPEVRVVVQPESGPAATRNLGISNATGEFVAFLDADDLWHSDKLAQQYQCFLQNPEIEYCVTYAQMFWADALDAEKKRLSDHPRAKPVPGYTTPTLLARRSLFDRIGVFNTQLSFSDATEWFIRASEQKIKMKMLSDVLTFHRMHASNLTRRQTGESREEFLKIVTETLKRKREKENKGTS